MSWPTFVLFCNPNIIAKIMLKTFFNKKFSKISTARYNILFINTIINMFYYTK